MTPSLIAPGSSSDPVVKRVFDEIERELGFGMVPNVFRSMANHPGLLDATWSMFRAVVLKGRMPRVVKEMIGIVVSYVHDSHYARDVHLHSLTVQGIDGDVLGILARGDTPSRGLPRAHAAVLAFVRQAATKPQGVSKAAYQQLVDAGLESEDIIEVIATIELFSAINAYTDIAAVPLDAL
ncbi:peroxidase-related enzyme [soil metagenome]